MSTSSACRTKMPLSYDTKMSFSRSSSCPGYFQRVHNRLPSHIYLHPLVVYEFVLDIGTIGEILFTERLRREVWVVAGDGSLPAANEDLGIVIANLDAAQSILHIIKNLTIFIDCEPAGIAQVVVTDGDIGHLFHRCHVA